MISSWRRKKASRGAVRGGVDGVEITPAELITPNHFRCPISLDTMKDPVTLSTGITYDRESIEKWIEAGNVTCPVTNQVLRTIEPVPNHTIRKMIQEWCVENRAYGVERIPTPRIPISADEVCRVLERISNSRDPQECRELVGRIIRVMKESERNKKCVLRNGAGRTLASTFYSFAESEGENVISLLEDVMGGLTSMMPLDYESEGHLKLTRSLDHLIWFMQRGSLSGRINSSLILKQLISTPRCRSKVVETLGDSEGVVEGLIKLIKEPICASSTKASLVIIYHMITSSTHDSISHSMLVGQFVDLGLTSLVLDILVDCDKSMCEKSLGVLDAICRCHVGREAAYVNALTVPIVVKKMLRVSEMATEFSVSILSRLCDYETREIGGVVVEALQVGAFQKLLLILQVGWNINERTKEKVTKLLKILNLNRGKVECVESMDFKNLKRSF
ncbi:U-box domain-containing protein 21-like [Silene latifolia]|uniref:U-box domain-containing protein 21-like n=1 Tax=Silene latifolia TaxID=37657 RepID=UPI003D777E55